TTLVCAGVAVRLAPAHAQAARVSAGDILVADPDAGTVVAFDSDNRTRQIQTGLKRPTGVTALADGSVLVAESGNNRILGYGGRGADGAPVAAGVPGPQGRTTGSDGAIYVRLTTGQVGKRDLNQPQGQRYVKIAEGLRAPMGIVERGGFLIVAESAAGVITQVAATGEKLPIGDGFTQPVGVAAGPGNVLFVADQKTGKITKLDGGEVGAGRPVEAPQQI